MWREWGGKRSKKKLINFSIINFIIDQKSEVKVQTKEHRNVKVKGEGQISKGKVEKSHFINRIKGKISGVKCWRVKWNLIVDFFCDLFNFADVSKENYSWITQIMFLFFFIRKYFDWQFLLTFRDFRNQAKMIGMSVCL